MIPFESWESLTQTQVGFLHPTDVWISSCWMCRRTAVAVACNQRCKGVEPFACSCPWPWLTLVSCMFCICPHRRTQPGSTRRKYKTCAEDKQLEALIAAGTECVCIFAKAWALHVDDILEVRVIPGCDGVVLIDAFASIFGALLGRRTVRIFHAFVHTSAASACETVVRVQHHRGPSTV